MTLRGDSDQSKEGHEGVRSEGSMAYIHAPLKRGTGQNTTGRSLSRSLSSITVCLYTGEDPFKSIVLTERRLRWERDYYCGCLGFQESWSFFSISLVFSDNQTH